MSNKDLVVKTLRQMPEGATLEEISKGIAVLDATHKGEAAAGQVALQEKVRRQMLDLSGRARALAALERIAERGTFNGIDPVAWQREIRADRPLPGREE